MKFLKNKKIVKPVVVGLLTLSLLIGGGAGLKYWAGNVFEDYADNDMQADMADSLECDDSYRQKWGYRLKHNNNEPIYVSISDDLSSEHKADIIEALDYIFGILGEINPKYRYEIVDNARKLNKTSIAYDLKNLKEGEALHTGTQNNFLSVIDGQGMMSMKHTVFFDREYVENEQDLFSTTLHETLHCLGKDDVYLSEKSAYHGNTLINIQVENKGIKMLTPNDVKLLYVMYQPKLNSQEEKNEYVAKAKQKIDEYSQMFYTYHNKQISQYYQEYYEKKDFPQAIIDLMKTHIPFEDGERLFKVNSNMTKVKFLKISVDDGKYSLYTLDENKNVMDECYGLAYYVDGTIYLQNVQLDTFIQDRPSIMDLCIGKRIDGNCFVKDLSESSVSFGKDVLLEEKLFTEKE